MKLRCLAILAFMLPSPVMAKCGILTPARICQVREIQQQRHEYQLNREREQHVMEDIERFRYLEYEREIMRAYEASHQVDELRRVRGLSVDHEAVVCWPAKDTNGHVNPGKTTCY